MMALGAIGMEQLRRRLAGGEILCGRLSACECGRKPKNKNRNLLHCRATLVS
jgi:hypothetical protein